MTRAQPTVIYTVKDVPWLRLWYPWTYSYSCAYRTCTRREKCV